MKQTKVANFDFSILLIRNSVISINSCAFPCGALFPIRKKYYSNQAKKLNRREFMESQYTLDD